MRVSFAPNTGPRAAKPSGAPSVVQPDGAALLAEAVKKLRLKKKEASSARLFVWSKDDRAGTELPREGSVSSVLRNDDLIAISFGEAYQGPKAAASTSAAGATSSIDGTTGTRWLRWETRSQAAGTLAVVEWSDARTMNSTLGRMSTLLEHPTLCGAETGRLVEHQAQLQLPSNSYLGHNLYSPTLLEFERLAAAAAAAATTEGAMNDSEGGSGAASASRAELAFIALWRERGSPEVIISFVSGEASTLSHELCHARFALDARYRAALLASWEDTWQPKLGKWMGDLGYHRSRHADEFGAYLLTEAPTFWRGRVPPAELKALRTTLLGTDSEGDAVEEAAQGIEACDVSDDAQGAVDLAAVVGSRVSSSSGRWTPGALEMDASVPTQDLAEWF